MMQQEICLHLRPFLGLKVNEVKAAEGIVKGEAVAGSTIQVFSGEEILGESVSNADRTFSIPLQNLQNGQVLIVKALKEDKVFAEVSVTIGDDSNPSVITPPKVRIIDDSQVNINGTTSPKSAVKVYLDGQVLATGSSNDEGVFSIPLSNPIQAGKVLEIVTVDQDGKESEPARMTVISKDARTPELSADTVTVTNNQTLIADEINVKNLKAGDVVTVYRSKEGTEILAQETVADGQTEVNLTVEELGKEEGSVHLSVTSEDKAESALTEVSYGKEPGGIDECIVSNILYSANLSAAVPVLQNFRDDVLMHSSVGQAFVKNYYQLSPKLIEYLL